MQTNEQKETVKKWIEALRSGEYKQGFGYLKSNGTYCCLGVLCEIKGVFPRPNDDEFFLFAENEGSYKIIPKDFFCEWTGLDIYVRHTLIILNDKVGLSFNNIADYINSFVEVENAN